jgi:hypothetical protein
MIIGYKPYDCLEKDFVRGNVLADAPSICL